MFEQMLLRAIELTRYGEENAETIAIRTSEHLDDLIALSFSIMTGAKLPNIPDDKLLDAFLFSITMAFNIGYDAGKLVGEQDFKIYQDNLSDINTNPSIES